MHLLVASLHSRVSESLRTLNDPSLSRRLSAEELANALTHGVGLIMSIVGFAILLSLAVIRGGALRIAGCAIYGGTLLSLYAASTCYHGSRSCRLKRILKICDHSAIYLLVGSHLYQVHLYSWLESNDYRRLLPDSKAYIYIRLSGVPLESVKSRSYTEFLRGTSVRSKSIPDSLFWFVHAPRNTFLWSPHQEHPPL